MSHITSLFLLKFTLLFKLEFTYVTQTGLELAILLNHSLKELGLQTWVTHTAKNVLSSIITMITANIGSIFGFNNSISFLFLTIVLCSSNHFSSQ